MKDVTFLSKGNIVMVYADNAATTKLDLDAFKAMEPFLLKEYGNASQPYSFGRTAKKALESSRTTIARCIGATPEEIYFTSGGTESINWVIKSTAIQNNFCGKIITSAIEHHAVLNACASIEHLGHSVIYLPVSSEGVIYPNKLEKAISHNTGLVSIMLANNEIGSIQPISLLANITHDNGALFHTDAVQALGHIVVNVRELDVDFLSASAHKFNAPKGVGFLYIRNGVKIPPYFDGGKQESCLRAGTENVASVVAMAVALKKHCDHMQDNTAKLKRIETRFIQVLSDMGIDFIRNGNEQGLPGVVSISIKGTTGEMLLHRLDLMGICVSTGSACDSAKTQVSHVIKAIQVPSEYAEGTIRISFGVTNDEKDAEQIATAIDTILSSK